MAKTAHILWQDQKAAHAEKVAKMQEIRSGQNKRTRSTKTPKRDADS